jgi:hypothetical protein
MSFYDDASWVLIPEGIKEDVVYAQKPTDGLGDLQFTRASDATRTNSAGVIERTPWNLITFSEMFSDVAWSKITSTITANTTAAPNGTLTADTLSANGALNPHYIGQPSPLVLGVTYTMSIYAKANTNRYVQMYSSGNGFGNNFFVNFDLQDGVVGTAGSTVLSSSIESIGDGWYRLTASAVALNTSSTNNGLVIGLVTSLTSARNESNTLSTNVFLWGAQLVEGTDAKPYFATTNRQDVPRLDYRNADGTVSTCPRLLLEPQRTNSIRNSTMVGAVAGSPGTLPTNWGAIATGGLNIAVAGLGSESGLQYIDLRFNGIATAGLARIQLEAFTTIAALNGQTWSTSTYAKIVAQPQPPLNYSLRQSERTSAGVIVTEGITNISPTTTLQRFSFVRTLNGGATTAFVVPEIQFGLALAAAYDFTIRIAAPQMELGAYATTFIPTTTAAVTRITDAASKTGISSLIGQTEGVIFLDFVFRTPATATGGQISITDQSAPFDRVLIWNNFTLNTLAANLQASGSTIFSTSLGTFVDGQRYKIAIAYKSGSNAGYVNGTQIFTNTNTFTFASTMTDIFLGAYEAVGMAPHQLLNQAALFKTRLTNAQLAQLTT